MYNLKHNNYNLKPKNSTIYTPPKVSQFIYELLRDKFPNRVGQRSWILDPCCGKGNLLEPWNQAGYFTYGVDLEKNNKLVNLTGDFLTMNSNNFRRSSCSFEKPEQYQMRFDLILCNPPFNGYAPKLGSEVWLAKIIELFGKEAPIVLFAPVGFCANLTLKSKRHEKFDNGTYPPIASRITLPKNVFEGVIFHSEILIFNIKGLKGHYFLPKY